MASLVSTLSKLVDSLPESYILPLDKRPGNFTSVCKNIPVIDLGNAAGQSRADLVQQIMKACQEYGIFQVVNHGVSEKMMQDAMSLFKELFNLSVEDKASYIEESGKRSCRLYTSGMRYAEGKDKKSWRDTLVHPCLPLDQNMTSWPEKPKRYKEVVEPYSVEVRKLGLQILEIICEGLGLKEGHLGGNVGISQALSIHYYPPCPEPSLAMGVNAHCDAGLMTMIQQDVLGLQTFKDGQWMGVEPLPDAFVVQIGYQMEIISNGKLKSSEHRGVTNSSAARTSIGSFFRPYDSAVIGPAEELVTDDNPPRFKTFTFREFMKNYLEYSTEHSTSVKVHRIGTPLDFFKL